MPGTWSPSGSSQSDGTAKWAAVTQGDTVPPGNEMYKGCRSQKGSPATCLEEGRGTQRFFSEEIALWMWRNKNWKEEQDFFILWLLNWEGYCGDILCSHSHHPHGLASIGGLLLDPNVSWSSWHRTWPFSLRHSPRGCGQPLRWPSVISHLLGTWACLGWAFCHLHLKYSRWT